jgi:hypothetical protein
MKKYIASLPKVIESDALFDSTGKHRLWLKRVWNREKLTAVFVMLNPSFGNKIEDDNTIKRSISKTYNNNCGSLEIINLYSYVTSKPEELWKLKSDGENILHLENDHHLKEACKRGDIIVVATGETAAWPRLVEILNLIKKIGKSAKCVGQTKLKFPKHPLFVSNDVRFVNFEI